ncbi:hypothetical protein QW71_12985 [Paenibacillus sp. IHB B 3415]|uniref:hypothetical protein n=1 Tax=Paenibacillus sp. IHB B 3415 TaxID=867080 RepID=UPI000573607C|nr:hypothetical protein [Paenibacillus sp. IHB B 3415]KHL95372.1 hypothetical protein QW71_12985 [Paenibacillus sp. IHB B 3415]
MKKATINVTVKLVPHPDPQRLIDVWARLILKEILRQEADAAKETVAVSGFSGCPKKGLPDS